MVGPSLWDKAQTNPDDEQMRDAACTAVAQHRTANCRCIWLEGVGRHEGAASKQELGRKLTVNRAGSSARPGTGQTPHPCEGLGGHIVRDPRRLFSRFGALRPWTIAIPAG
jgi:hypothetical protein